ncbi:MAG: hypothetical protein IT443_13875 [Phycisphaeraceae bacterium]|nr:hypothetical protein [Phycisphaeraceae bacterium]
MDSLHDWLSPARYGCDLAAAEAFWSGTGRYVISLSTMDPPYWNSTDQPVWLEQARTLLARQAKLPGLNLPWVRPVAGTVSIPRYWGCQVTVDAHTHLPFGRPVAATIDQALALKPLPVDHPQMDAAKVVRLYRQLSEYLRTDKLWLCVPDFQGVLNAAAVVLEQQELFMAMYSEPKKVHAFLERVCGQLIDLILYLRRQTGDRICGTTWPYTFFPCQFGVSVIEDMMPLLSAEIYQQFAFPQLRRMNQALGGLHIHCCGKYQQHVPTLAASDLKLAAMEYHHPYMTIEDMLPLAGRAVLVPFMDVGAEAYPFRSPSEYYRYLIEQADRRFRFWFACDDGWGDPGMRTFVEQFAPRK